MLAHQGALGDWVLTFPILRGLGALGPTLAVAPWSKAQLAAAVIAGLTPADIEAPPWPGFLRGDDAPSGGAVSAGAAGVASAARFGADDIIISFVNRADDPWAAPGDGRAPPGRRFLVDPRPPADWTGHVSAWHAQQLARQGLTLPQVGLPVRRRERGPVVIHPGSGGRDKCWPCARFVEVAQALRRRGREAVVVLGEVELERWPRPRIEELMHRHGAQALTDLADLHAMLECAAAFIGNDAGPTHLAAQLGVPTLALFGPTAPSLWRPIGPAVTVLAPPKPCPMSWLPAATVRARLDALNV